HPVRGRICVGVKQLDQDPSSLFLGEHPKGSLVNGKVLEVDAKGARIDLGNGIEGYLRASELSRERVEDARTALNEGEDIEARVIGVDRKNRVVNLSVKAKEIHEEREAISDYARSEDGGSTTLGDLLKEQMKK